MAHVLSWDKVSRFVSRNARRYSRYLESVLQVRADLPQAVTVEQPSEDKRRRVLTEIFLWVAHNHAHRRTIQEIDIRAVAWLLRIAYPCHLVFDSPESLRLSREEIFDGLNWVVGDLQFKMVPDSNDGAVLVAKVGVVNYYFDPLQMIAPNFSQNARVPFSQKTAARRIAEYMFRIACTVEDSTTEDDINDLAIYTAADRLLETFASLADDGEDEN
jgi:plasmid stabilization system protein ParE